MSDCISQTCGSPFAYAIFFSILAISGQDMSNKKKVKLCAKNLENLDQQSTWKIFQVSQNLVPVETKPYIWHLHSLYSTLGPLNLIYSTYRFLWFVIFLKISDWWSFSVFKTTTGSQPEWRLLEVDEGDWRLLEVDEANYEGYWR